MIGTTRPFGTDLGNGASLPRLSSRSAKVSADAGGGGNGGIRGRKPSARPSPPPSRCNRGEGETQEAKASPAAVASGGPFPSGGRGGKTGRRRKEAGRTVSAPTSAPPSASSFRCSRPPLPPGGPIISQPYAPSRSFGGLKSGSTGRRGAARPRRATPHSRITPRIDNRRGGGAKAGEDSSAGQKRMDLGGARGGQGDFTIYEDEVCEAKSRPFVLPSYLELMEAESAAMDCTGDDRGLGLSSSSSSSPSSAASPSAVAVANDRILPQQRFAIRIPGEVAEPPSGSEDEVTMRALLGGEGRMSNPPSCVSSTIDVGRLRRAESYDGSEMTTSIADQRAWGPGLGRTSAASEGGEEGGTGAGPTASSSEDARPDTHRTTPNRYTDEYLLSIRSVLPPGWTLRMSRSRGRPYYTHPDYGQSWYCPVKPPEPSCGTPLSHATSLATSPPSPMAQGSPAFQKKLRSESEGNSSPDPMVWRRRRTEIDATPLEREGTIYPLSDNVSHTHETVLNRDGAHYRDAEIPFVVEMSHGDPQGTGVDENIGQRSEGEMEGIARLRDEKANLVHPNSSNVELRSKLAQNHGLTLTPSPPVSVVFGRSEVLDPTALHTSVDIDQERANMPDIREGANVATADEEESEALDWCYNDEDDEDRLAAHNGEKPAELNGVFASPEERSFSAKEETMEASSTATNGNGNANADSHGFGGIFDNEGEEEPVGITIGQKADHFQGSFNAIELENEGASCGGCDATDDENGSLTSLCSWRSRTGPSRPRCSLQSLDSILAVKENKRTGMGRRPESTEKKRRGASFCS